jgi:large subunit ribosomal protein L1
MGKIRIKTFDESSPEEEAKLKAKREAKKAEKIAAKNELKQAQGKKTNPQTDGTLSSDKKSVKEGQVEIQETVVETPEETIVTPKDSVTTPDEAVKTPTKEKKQKKEKFANASKKIDSKRHKENLNAVSRTQKYKLDQAIEALKKFKKSNFDETVELHINTREKGVSGQVVLPHGTGKTLKIQIADEATLAEVAKGKINFDVLVATPSMMPQLAKVARVLGPRGLMPNPKNGTITDNPAEAIKKLAGGQISYKTESAAPIIHTIVGKVSFDDNKLKDNVKAFLSSVGKEKIASVTLKSTMSPAIKLDYVQLSK